MKGGERHCRERVEVSEAASQVGVRSAGDAFRGVSLIVIVIRLSLYSDSFFEVSSAKLKSL